MPVERGRRFQGQHSDRTQDILVDFGRVLEYKVAEADSRKLLGYSGTAAAAPCFLGTAVRKVLRCSLAGTVAGC